MRFDPIRRRWCGGSVLSLGTRSHEAAPIDERLEAWVVAVRIPLGIHGNVNEMDVVHREGFVKPRKNVVAVAQAGVHQRQRIRRDVSLMRGRLDAPEEIT